MTWNKRVMKKPAGLWPCGLGPYRTAMTLQGFKRQFKISSLLFYSLSKKKERSQPNAAVYM